MPINGPQINNTDRINSVVGIKKYQQIKKVMSEFDAQLQQEINKQPHKVDHKIK